MAESTVMKQISRRQKNHAYYLLKLQAKAVILLFIVLFALFGLHISIVALSGAAISLIANLICIQWMFGVHSLDAKMILGRFYLAEVIKMMLTTMMFLCMFIFLTEHHFFLIIGYCGAQIGFWAAPIVTRAKSLRIIHHDDVEQTL